MTKQTHLLTKEGSNSKSEQIKFDILRIFANNGNSSIAEISRETNLSTPTITKILNNLIEKGDLIDYGKQETSGGRKPNIYGLNPDSGYFVGTDIRKHSINIGIIDFYGEVVYMENNTSFNLKDTDETLNQICHLTTKAIEKSGIAYHKIIAFCFNISGRINHNTGVSYNYFFKKERALADIFKEKLGRKVFIENDSRSMCYGEYNKGVAAGTENTLFINISWGLGAGMILDGHLHYGASGFSGEFGHMPFFNNEIFCHCGKKGCTETEASGSAMYRLLLAKQQAGARSILSKKIEQNEIISTNDMVQAVIDEDMLMIEIVEEVGNKLGKGIAGLINIFNPEMVVIGGSVACVGDYLLLPIKSSIKKYSLNLVSQDTSIKISQLGNNAGVIGACFIARNRILGIL
ncbi:MAG: ROK family transcriptional regulator [Phocaeicola sp.]